MTTANHSPRNHELSLDELEGIAGGAVFHGSDRADYVALGNDGVEYHAEGGDDYVSGGKGADTIDGGDGADRLFGNGGDDLLTGGEGNDTMYGGSGNDTLVGGAGNDQLTGGSGEDVFQFSAQDGGNDTITDFDLDDDSLTLDGVTSASFDSHNNILFYMDADGNACSIRLNGISSDASRDDILARITVTDADGREIEL